MQKKLPCQLSSLNIHKLPEKHYSHKWLCLYKLCDKKFEFSWTIFEVSNFKTSLKQQVIFAAIVALRFRVTGKNMKAV